jgi:Kef-type K+ transport system membrane component KefB
MLAFKPLFKKMGTNVQKAGKLSANQFAILVVCLLLAAIATDKVGLYSVFGGFIMGLAMPRDPVFQSELKAKLMDVVIVMILPMFFAFSGLKTNFLQLCSTELLAPCLIILLLSILSKYVPILLTMKACNYSWREASAIAGLCNARGLMELIVANIGLDYKIIDVNMYSIMILIAVVTTLGGMPIYNLSLGKQKML